MTLPNGLSTAKRNPDRREEHERHRRGNPKKPDRRKEPSLILPCIAICAALLAFGLYFIPWTEGRSGKSAAAILEGALWGTGKPSPLSTPRLYVLILTPCIAIAGIVAMAMKKSLAAPLFLFTGASAATLVSIPAAAAVLSSNVPSVSSSYTVRFMALVPIGVSLLLVTAACAAGVEIERRNEKMRTQIDDLRQAVANLHSDGGDLRPDDIECRIEELHSRIRALELKADAQRPADARQTSDESADSEF